MSLGPPQRRTPVLPPPHVHNSSLIVCREVDGEEGFLIWDHGLHLPSSPSTSTIPSLPETPSQSLTVEPLGPKERGPLVGSHPPKGETDSHHTSQGKVQKFREVQLVTQVCGWKLLGMGRGGPSQDLSQCSGWIHHSLWGQGSSGPCPGPHSSSGETVVLHTLAWLTMAIADLGSVQDRGHIKRLGFSPNPDLAPAAE